MFIACYNVFYSSQPVLAIGIFDQDVDVDHALKYPKLYAPGLSSALFNKREFFKSALQGFISSCFLFFLSHGETTALIHLGGHSSPMKHFVQKILRKNQINLMSVSPFCQKNHISKFNQIMKPIFEDFPAHFFTNKVLQKCTPYSSQIQLFFSEM